MALVSDAELDGNVAKEFDVFPIGAAEAVKAGGAAFDAFLRGETMKLSGAKQALQRHRWTIEALEAQIAKTVADIERLSAEAAPADNAVFASDAPKRSTAGGGEGTLAQAQHRHACLLRLIDTEVECARARTGPPTLATVEAVMLLDMRRGRLALGITTVEETEEFADAAEAAMSTEELLSTAKDLLNQRQVEKQKQGLHFLRLAALTRGDPFAACALAVTYQRMHDAEALRAYVLLTQVLRHPTHVDLNREVGQAVGVGARCFPQLLWLAVKYFQRCAVRGDAWSMVQLTRLFVAGRLGNLEDGGEGMFKRSDVAVKWMQIASRRVTPESDLYLAAAHLKGSCGLSPSTAIVKPLLLRVLAGHRESAAKVQELTPLLARQERIEAAAGGGRVAAGGTGAKERVRLGAVALAATACHAGAVYAFPTAGAAAAALALRGWSLDAMLDSDDLVEYVPLVTDVLAAGALACPMEPGTARGVRDAAAPALIATCAAVSLALQLRALLRLRAAKGAGEARIRGAWMGAHATLQLGAAARLLSRAWLSDA